MQTWHKKLWDWRSIEDICLKKRSLLCPQTCDSCAIVRLKWQKRMLSSPRSFHVSVTEVCPSACQHVRRILSLSINYSPPHIHAHTHTHTSPHLQTKLHNHTRFSGLREVYNPSLLDLVSLCILFRLFSSSVTQKQPTLCPPLPYA